MSPPSKTEAVVVDSAPVESVNPAGKHRRKSSTVPADVHLYKPEELKEYLGEDKDLAISPEVGKLNWKMTECPTHLEDAALLKTTPILSDVKVKKFTIFFNTGLHATARAASTPTGKTLGVTIMDVLMAIHKQMKKKHEDEIDLPGFKGLDWGRGSDLRNSEGGDWPAVGLVMQGPFTEGAGGKHKKH